MKNPDILNTSFNHSSWFIKRNEEGIFKPYLSKKLALQYFASCGDFINDNNVLRYSGKERGSYRMNLTETEYFNQLLKEKTEAKAEAQKYVFNLKNELSEENKTAKKHFLFKNCIVYVQVWFNSDYVSIGVNFIDYIQANGGDTKKILSELLN